MTILLIALAGLAVLDLLVTIRWLRADSDGRPPLPAGAAVRLAPAPAVPQGRLRRAVRRHWQAQVRLWARYGQPSELSGLDTRQTGRQLRWVCDRLVGDQLPAPRSEPPR